MNRCLICGTEIQPFISFGRMPIANGFLEPSQFKNEHFIELDVAHCPVCQMVQLVNLVDREKMFHENYAFFSSTSVKMGEHFKRHAENIIENKIAGKNDPFVVEIGSNDGIFLQHFAKRGIRHLGIEPSKNVAAVARQKGVESISKFFDEGVAKEIES